MSLDEMQEQVSYWKTRAAVAEQSQEDARARRDERRQSLTRLKEQHGDFENRLDEIECSCLNWNTIGRQCTIAKVH